MSNAAPKIYKKPTITDVALHANVSKSAVSHYINGRVNICSKETGVRISRAIEELNFVPARSILHQQARATQTIGVCVALPPHDKSDFAYTHLHDYWSGLGSVTDEFDYRLLHYPSTVRDSYNCAAFLDGSIDGLLLSANMGDQRFETLAKAGLPTVATARWSGLPEPVGSVWSDDVSAIDLAMNHLWKLGHRRIAHLANAEVSVMDTTLQIYSVNDASIIRRERYESWLSEKSANPWKLVVPCPGWDPLSFEQAKRALTSLLKRPDPASAVVCANDAIASSLLQAANVLGIEIPKSLSVVGIDNNVNASLSNPPLTSVELPFFEIGRSSLILLQRMMTGMPTAQRRISVPVTKLVVRSSTCPLDQ